MYGQFSAKICAAVSRSGSKSSRIGCQRCCFIPIRVLGLNTLECAVLLASLMPTSILPGYPAFTLRVLRINQTPCYGAGSRGPLHILSISISIYLAYCTRSKRGQRCGSGRRVACLGCWRPVQCNAPTCRISQVRLPLEVAHKEHSSNPSWSSYTRQVAITVYTVVQVSRARNLSIFLVVGNIDVVYQASLYSRVHCSRNIVPLIPFLRNITRV
jgi:hypothetical protein